jgi:hypothetical protein
VNDVIKNAVAAHGATVNTRVRQLKPQRKGQIRMSTRQNPPTFLDNGMIFEDHKGKTHAVWTDKAKSAGAPSYFKAWMFFLAALALLTTITVNVPVSVLVGVPAVCIWYLCRRAIPNPVRVREPESHTEHPLAGKVAPVYPRHLDHANERIGDDERDIVIYELGAHLQAGRLKLDEYDERSTEALNAVYANDLVHVLRELPYLESYERRIR